MRITNTMLVKDMLWNSNNNLVSMSKRQTELSTGKKIHRPSDDPVGITQVLKYKTDIREAEQYKKNINDALGWLEVSESSLHNVKEILQRVRELTVQAANGTNTADDTKKIKVEIQELTKEIIVAGNATNAGRYIFSGLQTNEKLFNEDGSYNIDMTSERRDLKHVMGYEVSVGEVMSVGVHPTDVFGTVDINNFFDGLITRNSTTTQKSTQATFRTEVQIPYNYAAVGNVLDITVGGVTFDVDESLLNSTSLNPLTKERFLEVMKSAANGTDALGDVADVFFDVDNQLVIRAKSYNPLVTIDDSLVVTGGFTGQTVTAGTPGVNSTLTGAGVVTDAAVIAETGQHTLVVQVDDVRKKITIDFSTLNSVVDLRNAIEAGINGVFPPGTVNVSAVDGGTIDLTLVATNDGENKTLSVDQIVASRSEMLTDLQALITALNTKDDTVIQASLTQLDVHLDRVLTVAGEIGGKTNRIEFVMNRVEENHITFTGLLSKVQDVDMAEAIMYFKNLENIYRASLSVGSKVIQVSLVDFIR